MANGFQQMTFTAASIAPNIEKLLLRMGEIFLQGIEQQLIIFRMEIFQRIIIKLMNRQKKLKMWLAQIKYRKMLKESAVRINEIFSFRKPLADIFILVFISANGIFV